MTDSNGPEKYGNQDIRQDYFNAGGYHTTPNSVAVLVLGILTIVFCWCYGLLSVILGIIALVLASEGEKQYRMNPQLYSISSYKNLKAGKTCAVIGLCLSCISILLLIIYLILFGTLAINFWDMNWR
jgi:hypothetical protein